MKISTYGGNEIRKCFDEDSFFDIKTTYLIAQVAHISCKTDNHEILLSSVLKPILDSCVAESKAKEKTVKQHFKDCQVLVSDYKKM